VTGFVDRLGGAISNVTLPMPRPDGAQRERRNLGAAVSRGVEVSADWRLADPLSFVVSYAFIRSTVTDAPDSPQLVGRALPQAPEHRATAVLTFDEPRLFSAMVVGRWMGGQFEDDLNMLPMGGTFLIDAAVSRRIAGSVEVFLAVENVFDREYLVGRAGVDTVGQPLTVRGGIRLRDRSSGRE
jgi:outer membrane receptor protein involved in Fe transport